MEVSGFQNTGRNLMPRSVKPWRSTFKSPTSLTSRQKRSMSWRSLSAP